MGELVKEGTEEEEGRMGREVKRKEREGGGKEKGTERVSLEG